MIKVNIQSSILIDDKVKVYFDPLKMDKRHDADYIFITHSHYDHFSKEDILNLKNDNTVIVCPYDIYDLCLEMGFKKENVFKIKPLDEYDFGIIKFKAIYAYNINKPFHPKENNWVGYLLEYNNIKYYIAGDTDITKENQNIVCDVAFVPIGGVYTMDYQEAAKLINKIKPRIAVPIHYGLIVGNKDDGIKFSKLLNNNIECKIFIK